MVGASAFHADNKDKLSVTISNLKTIEKEEQKKLYEDATSRDAFDSLSLTPYVPPKFSKFLEKIGLKDRISHNNLSIKSNKLLWENHHIVKSFTQEGLDFFTPGGHYFTWSSSVYRTRCTIFGPVESVYSVDWVHHRHGKSVPSASASAAYAGWVRVEYMEGRLKQITGTGIKPKADLLTGAQMII
jgi:hypothetical protein